MKLIRDGEPRMATSTFTQLMRSKARWTPLRLIYRARSLDPVKNCGSRRDQEEGGRAGPPREPKRGQEQGGGAGLSKEAEQPFVSFVPQ